MFTSDSSFYDIAYLIHGKHYDSLLLFQAEPNRGKFVVVFFFYFGAFYFYTAMKSST